MLVMEIIQKNSLFICSLVSEVAHPYTQRIEKRACERSGSEWVELSGLEIDLLSENGIPQMAVFFLCFTRII